MPMRQMVTAPDGVASVDGWGRRFLGVRWRGLAACCLLVAALASPGCAPNPRVVAPAARGPIDRSILEGPPGFTVHRYIENLTAPTAMTFDDRGNLLIAEGGLDGRSPAIYGFRPDGTRFSVYHDPQLPLGIASPRVKLYGPIGGPVFAGGKPSSSPPREQRVGGCCPPA